jgi:hypothetical protein
MIKRFISYISLIFIKVICVDKLPAAEAGRETRQGAESDEESDGYDGAQDCNTTTY